MLFAALSTGYMINAYIRHHAYVLARNYQH